MRPRFGLIRAKEFLMKDLYTFDLDLESAQKTYEEVNDQYVKVFNHLQIPFVKIRAGTGVMGGNESHEYHILTEIGEDQIVMCPTCSLAVNKELCIDGDLICNKCDKANLKQEQGIEIGHTFMLGDKYSKVFKATYSSKAGKPVVLQMGCYGIGVTRLIASCIEYLSTENEIRWPLPLAPYKVCIIPPKEGSNEEAHVKNLTEDLYLSLEKHGYLQDEIIIDDRLSMTIGKRLRDTQKLGIPFIIVIGSKATEPEPQLEIHNVNEGFCKHMTISDAINYISSQSCREK